jgi:mono/diheme cytochrome c family protein
MAMGRTNFRGGMLLGVLAVTLLWAGLSKGLAQEQEVVEAGKREFQRSCATCHGVEAKGDGPSTNALNVKPANLTQLSKNHGGVFLFWRTYEKISGADEAPIRGHGTREMPIWGERFRLERGASEEYQMGVRGRILSLVYYLQSIQEK